MLWILATLVLLVVIAGMMVCQIKQMNEARERSRITKDLSDLLRALLVEHHIWVRNFLLSPSPEVSARVMKNVADISQLLSENIPRMSGRLEKVLQQMGAAELDLIRAFQSKNPDLLKQARENLDRVHAVLIVGLNKLNPVWRKEDLDVMVKEAQTVLELQSTSRENQNWAGDVQAADLAERQALSMADYLTAGLLARRLD